MGKWIKKIWLVVMMLLVAGCGAHASPELAVSTTPPTATSLRPQVASRSPPYKPRGTPTIASPVASETIARPTFTPSAPPAATPQVPILAPTATVTPERPALSSTPATTRDVPAFTPTVTDALDAPVVSPTASPIPQPSPTPVPATTIAVWEGTITLNSYDWERALVETTPDDPIYPYPRLDREQIGPLAPRSYRTVVLENAYARLTLLPEMGGRLYRWLDKTSGQELFYVNPVLKPTHWGARGWWLAVGGMEWALPVDEHGLVEWRPWHTQIARGSDWASVTLSDRDDRTGLAVEVTVMLEAGRSYVTVRPRVYNPTETEQRYQFWLNGMFALSPDNRPGPDLCFTLPSPSVTVHSTSDGGLPGVGAEMSWPVYSGRDLSRYGNWAGWLGIFARPAAAANYMGAYDASSGMGVARVFPAAIARGAKVFGPAGIDPGIWTDDGSGYVELWGGLTPTFWDYAALPPGGSVGWQERWYSLGGLGGLSYANDDAALWLAPDAAEVRLGALTTAPHEGQLVLWHDGQVVANWVIATAPGYPFRTVHPLGGDGAWGLQLLDSFGQPIAAYGRVGD